MSTKRKQFKPKAFKDDEVFSNDCDDLQKMQEMQEKKRKRKNDLESEINGRETDYCVESSFSMKFIDMEIICSFCETRFDDIRALQDHTLQNHWVCRNNDKGPSLVCQQCGMTLYSFAEFGYHMRTHLISNDREQKCNLCNATFTDPISRISHTVEHYSKNIIHIRCKECTTVPFYNFQQIQQHYFDEHLEILYRCAICYRIFLSQHHFQEHSLAHIEEILRYYCAVCGIPFETRNLLEIHVQIIHGRLTTATLTVNNLQHNSLEDYFLKQEVFQLQSESRLAKCLVCDTKFESEDQLDFHRLFVHCKIPRSNRCANCQIQIHTITHFKDHIREHMLDEHTTAVCIICRQALRNDMQIDNHAKYHLQFN